jgi:hypothetical protein
MININIPEDIKEFVKDISLRVSEEFDVYIGGGFLRDNCKALHPKDLDLFFIPKVIAKTPAQVGYIPAKCYVNYNKNVANMSHTEDMDARGVSQVVGLFSPKLSTSEVQFIVYKKPMTMEDLAKDFDMNINQIVWCPTLGKVYASPSFTTGHDRRFILCMHEYNKVRMYDRYNRMELKFPDYEVIGKPLVIELPEITQLALSMGTHQDTAHVGSMIGEE